MRFWTPEPDSPQLLDWWVPLVRAARRALDDEVPWLILVDEWELRGRFLRRPRPDVWIYVHDRSGCELRVDGTGQTYRFIPNFTGPSAGRFKEVGVRTAIWQARLPHVSEGVWFDEPPPRYDPPVWQEPSAADERPGHRPALRLVK